MNEAVETENWTILSRVSCMKSKSDKLDLRAGVVTT